MEMISETGITKIDAQRVKLILEKSRFKPRGCYSIWSPKPFRTTELIWQKTHRLSGPPLSFESPPPIGLNLSFYSNALTPAWLEVLAAPC